MSTESLCLVYWLEICNVYWINMLGLLFNMSNLWIQHNGLDIKFAPIKQRIIDTYTHVWHSAINNSGRLMTYCNFKEENKLETYLTCIQTKRFRIALTKRSSHDLAIERGRHVPSNERYCRHFTIQTIENEYHFLLVCPKVASLRRKYFTTNRLSKLNQKRCSQNTVSVKSSKSRI